MIKQIMALELQETPGQFPLMALEDLGDSHPAVVVAYPPRDSPEALEGSNMPFPEGFCALPLEGLKEEGIREG
jgi:hypothetical protein